MTIASAVRALLDAGITGEALIKAIENMEAKQAELISYGHEYLRQKEKKSERNRRHYQKSRAHSDGFSVLKTEANSEDLRRIQTDSASENSSKKEPDTPTPQGTPPKGGSVGGCSGEVSEAFDAVWESWKAKLKQAKLERRLSGKTKTLEVWRAKAKKFGLSSVVASCDDAIRKTEPKYLENLIVFLRKEGAENFKASPEPSAKVKSQDAPLWRKMGYRSEQHWIDCDRGNIAPNADEPEELWSGDEAERLAS